MFTYGNFEQMVRFHLLPQVITTARFLQVWKPGIYAQQVSSNFRLQSVFSINRFSSMLSVSCVKQYFNGLCADLEKYVFPHSSTSNYILPPLSLNLSPVDGTGLSARKHHNSRSSNGSNARNTPLHRYARTATTQAIKASIQ